MKIIRFLQRRSNWYDPDLKGSLAERMLEAEFRNVRDYDAPRLECVLRDALCEAMSDEEFVEWNKGWAEHDAPRKEVDENKRSSK